MVSAELDALANVGHTEIRIFNRYIDDEPTRRALATTKARHVSR